MKICIEDYFGNDLLIINYVNTIPTITDNSVKVVDEIANVHGYNVADIEDDVIRVQCVDVVDCHNTNKKNLNELVVKLNNQYI